MRKVFIAAAAALAATGSMAASTGFGSSAVGTYSSLTDTGVTFTYEGGDGRFDVESASPGSPISGNALISFRKNPGPEAFKATMAGGFGSFSIGCGDFGADDDDCRLEAYSASHVLLASASFFNPAGNSGGGMMTVSSATPIAYVRFYEIGSFAGAVYWDNAEWTQAVPEPGTYALMALGLAAVGAVARRQRKG